VGFLDRPSVLHINAWTGGPAGVFGANWPEDGDWGAAKRAAPATNRVLSSGPVDLPDDADWRHPDVGWGLVVADDPAMSNADKAAGVDLPAPLKTLLDARQGLLFRYVPSDDGTVRRYYADGGESDWDPAGTTRGRVGDLVVPKYLLIYGAPQVIPWRFQYALNMSSYVGRLHLEGDALARYVEALMNGFSATSPRVSRPVIWSVNFGGSDITSLMQQAIADDVQRAFAGGGAFAPTRLADGDATLANLADALKAARPALIVTTSHGLTGPAADPAGLQAKLGGLVDAERDVLTAALLQPESFAGAIWYAHACCSAGSDRTSQFEALFKPGNDIGDTLRAVAAAAGDMIAPLPQALLGADPPLRAFVGHVEPTFDWTLRDPRTGQVLTSALRECLYTRLHQSKRQPIGYALARIYDEAGTMLTLYNQAMARVNKGDFNALDAATYRQVAALDRQSLVILGDPTVTIPDGD